MVFKDRRPGDLRFQHGERDHKLFIPSPAFDFSIVRGIRYEIRRDHIHCRSRDHGVTLTWALIRLNYPGGGYH